MASLPDPPRVFRKELCYRLWSLKAIDHLIYEHRATRSVLDLALRSLDPLDLSTLEYVLEFFKHVNDRAHHAKEEDVLFPALLDVVIADEADAVRALQREHDKSHAQIRDAFAALDAAASGILGADQALRSTIEALVARARAHMHKEERVLFPMAQGWLPQSLDQELLARMARVQTRLVETDRYEALMARAHRSFETPPPLPQKLPAPTPEKTETKASSDGVLTLDLDTSDIVDITSLSFGTDNHRILRWTTNRPDVPHSYDAIIIHDAEGLVLNPSGSEATLAEVQRTLASAELKLVVFSERHRNLRVAVHAWLTRSRAEVWVPEPWLRYEAEPSWTKPWQGRLRSLPDEGRNLEFGSREVWLLPAHGLTASVGFHVYDYTAKALLSHDLGITSGPSTTEVTNFAGHGPRLLPFHRRMIDLVGLAGWVERTSHLALDLIIPRRGPILRTPAPEQFLEWCKSIAN